jgi:hypothetical protein
MYCRLKPKEQCITWIKQLKKLQSKDTGGPREPVASSQEGVIEIVTVLQSASETQDTCSAPMSLDDVGIMDGDVDGESLPIVP